MALIVKNLDEYRVGDRVGIFTLLFLSDNEIIQGDSDKHLDVKVSVFKEKNHSVLIVPSSIIRTESIKYNK